MSWHDDEPCTGAACCGPVDTSPTLSKPLPPMKYPGALPAMVWVHDEKGYVGEIEKLTVYLATWKPGRRRTA